MQTAEIYNPSLLRDAIEKFTLKHDTPAVYNNLHKHLSLCIHKVFHNMCQSEGKIVSIEEYQDELTLEICCLANNALKKLEESKIKTLINFIEKITFGLDDEIRELSRKCDPEKASDSDKYAQIHIKTRELRAWCQLLTILQHRFIYKDSKIFNSIAKVRDQLQELEDYSRATSSKEKSKAITELVSEARKHTCKYFFEVRPLLKKKTKSRTLHEGIKLKATSIRFKRDIKESLSTERKAILGDHQTKAFFRKIYKSVQTLLAIISFNLTYFNKNSSYGNFWCDQTKSLHKADKLETTICKI